MKSKYFILRTCTLSILTFLSLIFLVGCPGGGDSGTKGGSTLLGGNPIFTSTYIFVDVTDSTSKGNILTNEQIEEILRGMGLKEGGNLYNGGEVKLMMIDDLSMTKVKKIKLNRGESGLLAKTASAQKTDVNTFEKNLLSLSNDFKKSLTFGKNQSEIYSNLCRQLKNLSNESSDRKNVIIFSDMLENSNCFNLYDKGFNVDNLIKKANSCCSFPKLDEINIYVIPPISSKTDNLVIQAEKFWLKLFENARKFEFDVNLEMD